MENQLAVVADDRQEFHEERMLGLGATDSPKILGFSKRGTALSVYLQKIGEAGESAMSLPAWLGLKLEDAVGELYSAREGFRLRHANKQYVHPQHAWMRCHLDFRVWGHPELLVECKTRAYKTGFGEDGTEEVPLDIWCQCQHEMAVTGALRDDVAVLFGHHTFHVYPIHRNDQFIDSMIPRLSEFWHENVLQRVPPAATGAAVDEAALRRLNREDDGVIVPATPEQVILVNRYRFQEEAVESAKGMLAELKNQIIQIIGPNAGLSGSFGSITLKKSKPSVSVGWEVVANEYSKMIEALLDMAAPGDNPEAVSLLAQIQALYPLLPELHTTISEGSRRWHTSWKD